MKEARVSLGSVLRRQIWWLFMLSALIFAGCFFGLSKIPPLYQVKAVLNVEKGNLGFEGRLLKAEGSEAAVGNIAHFLKSDSLLQKTLNRLNYKSQPSAYAYRVLKTLLNIEQITPGTLISVGLVYNSPQEAALIVNTLIETLIEEENEKRRKELAETKSALRVELQNIREKMAEPKKVIPVTKRPSTPPVTKIQLKEYLQTTAGDIRYTKGKIEKYLSALHEFEVKELKKILTPDHWILKNRRDRFRMEEKKLVQNLLAGGWNSAQTQNSLREIWRLKTKTADTFKRHYNRKLPGPDNIKNALYVFFVNLYDLQFRREELRNYQYESPSVAPASTGGGVISAGKQLNLKVLQDMEIKILHNLAELESMEEILGAEISWVQRAVPPEAPLFPSRPLVLAFSIISVLLFVFLSICLGYSHDKKWNQTRARKDLD